MARDALVYQRHAKRHLVWLVALLFVNAAMPVNADEPREELQFRLLKYTSFPTDSKEPNQPWETQATLELSIHGQSPASNRTRLFQSLFEFFDVDSNNVLGPDESQHLPAPECFRRLLDTPIPIQFETLQSSCRIAKFDGAAQLQRHYEALGTPFIHWSMGQDGVSPALSQLVLENHVESKTLPPTERRNPLAFANHARADAFYRLDQNGDNVLVPNELIAGVAYPSTWANDPLMPTASADALRVEARAKTTQRHSPAGLCLKVQIVNPDSSPHYLFDNSIENAHEPSIFRSGERVAPRFVIHHSTSHLASRAAASRERLLRAFRAADTNQDGLLHGVEFEVNEARVLHQIFKRHDPNGDQQFALAELEGWCDFWIQMANSQVSARVCFLPVNIFTQLDENLDGRITRHEFQRVPSLTAQQASNLTKPPFDVVCVFSIGTPTRILPSWKPRGPTWFQASDRNRDGLVSPDEFIGSRAQFGRLDLNADHYLQPSEAEGSATSLPRD